MIDTTRALLLAAQRPVVFSGAGLSAESGIPTFRDARTGLWAKYDPAELASPGGFAADPELVVEWYNWRRRTVAAAEPNAAHRAVAGITQITQNVDDLLERAGSRQVLHLHGSLTRDRCHRECGYREDVDLADPPSLRRCPRCDAPMRPDVVWFGEQLPDETWRRAQLLAASADVFLVIGTSATVYPAAGLIDAAASSGSPVIVVDRTAGRAGSLADVELIGPAGELVPELLKGR